MTLIPYNPLIPDSRQTDLAWLKMALAGITSGIEEGYKLWPGQAASVNAIEHRDAYAAQIRNLERAQAGAPILNLNLPLVNYADPNFRPPLAVTAETGEFHGGTGAPFSNNASKPTLNLGLAAALIGAFFLLGRR